MVDLLEDCRKFFGSDDLYKVLNVEKDAQDSECKYRIYNLFPFTDFINRNNRWILSLVTLKVNKTKLVQ